MINWEDSTTYQELMELGKARGALQQAREMLFRLGTKRFGAPPEPIAAAICTIADQDWLERMTERVLDATGWDDVRTTE